MRLLLLLLSPSSSSALGRDHKSLQLGETKEELERALTTIQKLQQEVRQSHTTQHAHSHTTHTHTHTHLNFNTTPIHYTHSTHYKVVV